MMTDEQLIWMAWGYQRDRHIRYGDGIHGGPWPAARAQSVISVQTQEPVPMYASGTMALETKAVTFTATPIEGTDKFEVVGHLGTTRVKVEGWR